MPHLFSHNFRDYPQLLAAGVTPRQIRQAINNGLNPAQVPPEYYGLSGGYTPEPVSPGWSEPNNLGGIDIPEANLNDPFAYPTGNQAALQASGQAYVGMPKDYVPFTDFSDAWKGQLTNPPPNDYEIPTGTPTWNPIPEQQGFSPIDTYSFAPLYNPAPWNESPAPVDIYSGYQPTNPEPWNESASPVDTYSTGTVYGQGSASVGDPFSGASAEGEAPLFDPFSGASVEGQAPVDPFAGASVGGEAPFNPFAGATAGAGYHQQSSAQAGSSEPWDTAPHTGEVFAATQIDPNTGQISTFDPTTGGYTPVAGAAGWTTTGFGHGSAFGAGAAGPGGGGFGGYGGLGGSGAPMTGHIGSMVDTSTPEGLSHGGVDPTGSGDSPQSSAITSHRAPEGAIKALDIPKGIEQWDAQKAWVDSLPTPAQQYVSGYQWSPSWGIGGSSFSQSGGGHGAGEISTQHKGMWAPTYTTDPTLAIQSPTTPGWQYNKLVNPGTPQVPAVPTHLAQGGIVDGVDYGVDSVPSMLRPGEVVLNEEEQRHVRPTGKLPVDIAQKLYQARRKAA